MKQKGESMKKKSEIGDAIKALEAIAKLIRVAKCYNCIHKFEAKKKFTKGIIVGEKGNEIVLPITHPERQVCILKNES